MGEIEETVGQRDDLVVHDDPLPPPFRYAVEAVQRSGQLPEDCCCRIGIVSEVDGCEDAILERSGRAQRPERRLERIDDVAPAPDARRLLRTERPCGDRGDLRMQRLASPEAAHRLVEALMEKSAD